MLTKNWLTENWRTEKLRLLGVPVDGGTFAQTLDSLAAARGHVIVANVHLLYEARHNPEVMAAFEQAAMVVTDGMPLVWLAGGNAERITGIALMEALCAKGGRMFFLGGAEGVADEVAKIMEARYPDCHIAGAICPPFRPLSETEETDLLAQINTAEPDIVFVAFGAPKQELWMAKNAAKLNARLVIGVGAAFNYATGRLQRAPRWMQVAGLEWLYRLMQEPRRLFKRYFITNLWFIREVLTSAPRRSSPPRLG